MAVASCILGHTVSMIKKEDRMSGFKKDTVYYRGNIVFGCGVDTSSYLGEDNIDAEKLALDLKFFVEDEDAKTFDITRHVAKKGDGLAHVDKVMIRLAKKNGKICVEGGQNG